jgi:CheY-like chemotaxis protein
MKSRIFECAGIGLFPDKGTGKIVSGKFHLDLFLDQLGANVVMASNAFEGLEAIKRNHPDLVVSDIKMPGVDGLEILRQIRALDPDSEGSVPVIAMTALVGRADRTRLRNSGFQACLPKPFSPGKLLETILTVLNDYGRVDPLSFILKLGLLLRSHRLFS